MDTCRSADHPYKRLTGVFMSALGFQLWRRVDKASKVDLARRYRLLLAETPDQKRILDAICERFKALGEMRAIAETQERMVPRTGFEPVISSLKG